MPSDVTSTLIEWRQPRDVYLVRLHFAEDAPAAETLHLDYWYHVWPENGGGGWMRVDDPFNGEFRRAATDVSKPNARTLELRFKPLDKQENPALKLTGMDWRRTYRIRISCQTPAGIERIECLTDSRWLEASVKIELAKQSWDGHVEARNGEILTTQTFGPSSCVVKLRYADNADRLSPDRGYLIVRRGGQGIDFSVFIDDVLREGKLRVPDLNAMISNAAANASRAASRPSNDTWDATVIEKVAALPEQTMQRALHDIPPKWICDAHLGLPSFRQEVSINSSSQIYTEFRSLRTPGQDRDRSPMLTREDSQRQYTLVTRQEPFGPPGPKSIKRWIEEEYLPVIHSQWKHEEIAYHQAIFVTALDPGILEQAFAPPQPPPIPLGSAPKAANYGSGLKGDEPIAALSRLEIENPGDTERTATMWLKISKRPPMRIDADGLLVLDRPTRPPAGEGLTPVWGQIITGGKGRLEYLKNHLPDSPGRSEPRDLIRYTLKLAPHEKHTIVFKVPYLEQLTPGELAQLKALDWEASHARIIPLWKQRLAAAIENYQVPEPLLMNFYRANLWHVLISTDRDVATGLYEHGASVYDYPMYANETMMVARSLEMRGEHEEARRMIEPYLISQGTKSLPGNFKSKEGLLYAAAPKGFDHYTAQGYNMHHGFILWAAAEHYQWTRDRKYLDAAAPHLIAACDWITRERQATMVMNPDGTRPLEYGLAPAGDLEDVAEYLYWYTTNAYYYLGMKTSAHVLAEIHHPEAARIADDAESYARDILASVRESVATSPVVRLLDGSYVPYVPPRAYVLTDLKEGWIRESLYCALHLLDARLIQPNDPMTTWILNDLEDRIFMSEESGYGPRHGLNDPRTQFFSFGGFNPQPNLLGNSVAYLRRGQIASFERAFFNTFSVSYYPDVVCFIEALLTFGQGGSPLYKTPDEGRFIQQMRQMLVLEEGDDLYLGRGVPRAWMTNGQHVVFKHAATFFGPMDLEFVSAVGKGEIRAQITLPSRNPPGSVHLSLRHPDGRKLSSVQVNGKDWMEFDAANDVVTLRSTPGVIGVVGRYH